MFIVSMASVSATDVSDIDDINQDVLINSDSLGSVSALEGSYGNDVDSLGSVSALEGSYGNDVDSLGSVSALEGSYGNDVDCLSNGSLADGDSLSEDDSSIGLTYLNGSGVSDEDETSNGQVNSSDSYGKSCEISSAEIGNSSKNVLGASSNSSSAKSKNLTVIESSSSSISRGDYYQVTLRDKNSGSLLSGKNISFLFDGKTYIKTTDSKGVASIFLNASPGDYVIYYSYAGDSDYQNFSSSASVKILKTQTALVNSGSSVINGTAYYLRIKDSSGNLLFNKTVHLCFNGLNYNRTSNSKGLVCLTIKGAIGKTYKFSYDFEGDINYSSSSGLVMVTIKMPTSFVCSGSTIIQGNVFSVSLKDSKGNVLSKKNVLINFSGRIYNKTTNSNGIAKLKVTAKSNRTYVFTCFFAGNSYYGNSSKSGSLYVKTPTSLDNSGKSIVYGNVYRIRLKDSSGNLLSNKTVNLCFNGLNYKRTSDSNGLVYLTIKGTAGKSYKFVYSFSGDSQYGSSSGSAYVKIKKATSLIASSSSTVIRGNSYSVVLKDSSANPLSGKTVIFTFGVRNYTKTTNSKGIASLKITALAGSYNMSYRYGGSSYYGNSSSGVKKISVVNATSSSSGALSYSSVTKKGSSSQYKAGLNEIANLSASQLKSYLSSSGYDSLNSAIKTLANKLVSGKSSDWAKAEAIFNYVRDDISYSFYSNSKKGASTTLSSKSANCCDQANLVVALCRAANIPARFSHGQGCTFSSGLVTGHVWAQIYVDGVWYSADATSSRNSLGNIKNWNVKSFYSLKQYAHLPF